MYLPSMLTTFEDSGALCSDSGFATGRWDCRKDIHVSQAQSRTDDLGVR